MFKTSSQKGQSILPEYVVMFFFVIAAMVSMTVYVQRGLQARQRDAKAYFMKTASDACKQADAASGGKLDCAGAASIGTGNFAREYEPYYGDVASKVSRDSTDSKRMLGGIARTTSNRVTEATTNSAQQPPRSE